MILILRSQLNYPPVLDRNHHLARHADILQCIETRISMLMMTYSKYIEANLCCFIPGRVIDEVMRLLRLVGNTGEQFRAREILQELRDITSMAIEHFDEKIAPDLKKLYQENAKFQLKGTPLAMIISAMRSPSGSLADESLLDASTSSSAGDESGRIATCCSNTHTFFMTKMNARIKREIKTVQIRHMKLIRAQNLQIAELRSQVGELKRRVDETDAKNREIHARLNVNQMQTQQPSPAELVTPASDTFIRKSNIKPRTATIILKRRIEQFAAEKAAEEEAAASGVTSEETGLPAKRTRQCQ